MRVRDLVLAAAASDARAIRPAARLMSIVADEPSRLAEVYQATAELEQGSERLLLPRLLLGVTGAPGSGKSTLTDALVREYRRRSPGLRVGVIAVDPSSPFTGGAVLGDRVRMMRHATDPMVFVRSMAARGHLGGLALGVKGVIRVMALIGCEVVVVETVGVGQSEVEVASVADVVMIVMAPGQGDGVQLLKAGLMEIGDVFVVNKADRPDAARLHADLLAMLELARRERPHEAADPGDAPDEAPVEEEFSPLITRRPGALQDPRTYLVSAELGQGVETLVDGLEQLAGEHGPGWQQRRRNVIEAEVREAVLEEAAGRLRAALPERGVGDGLVADILSGRLSVTEAACRVLKKSAC